MSKWNEDMPSITWVNCFNVNIENGKKNCGDIAYPPSDSDYLLVVSGEGLENSCYIRASVIGHTLHISPLNHRYDTRR